MANISREGAVCQAAQLVTAMQNAVDGDIAKMTNLRKRKGGEVDWAAAAHFLAVLTGDSSWEGAGTEMAELYWRSHHA